MNQTTPAFGAFLGTAITFFDTEGCVVYFKTPHFLIWTPDDHEGVTMGSSVRLFIVAELLLKYWSSISTRWCHVSGIQ